MSVLFTIIGNDPILHINANATRADIQNYLSALVDKEKYRTAEKLKVQLKAIFDVAVSDYNFKSPMTKVEVTKYEVKKGNSLSLPLPKSTASFYRT